MSAYLLTQSAEEDLQNIARFTFTQWGRKQSAKYADTMEKHFQKIAEGKVSSRSFSDKHPEVKVTLCKYHYIFYTQETEQQPPCIIAVLNERMDITTV